MKAGDRVRRLLDEGELVLPAIGHGETRERWRRLAAIARADVATARLAEAHIDATQILHEAGCVPTRGRVLGVWASESARETLRFEVRDGTVTFYGSKGFCTGAGIVDDALVTASCGASPVLFLVPGEALNASRIDLSAWRGFAMRDTNTALVDFDGLTISARAQVGDAGWYLDRPGFWHGAIGPAACWAGAAQGLIDHALGASRTDAHDLAHLGAMAAIGWSFEAILDAAGAEADRHPDDARLARTRALAVRHLVDAGCGEVQDRFGRALGPRPLAFDADVIERFDALTLYRRQCHAERDLAELGSAIAAPPKRSSPSTDSACRAPGKMPEDAIGRHAR
ncbi:MAG TPA: hypothetical protein VGO03_13665 [Acidimicrobiia bacterium]